MLQKSLKLNFAISHPLHEVAVIQSKTFRTQSVLRSVLL